MAVEVDRLLVALEARIGPYVRDMQNAQRQTNRSLDQIERRFASTSRNVKASVGSMGAVLGTIGAYLSVDQLVGYANAWVRVTRSIEGSGDVFGISLKSAEELTKLANDSRVDLEAYSKLYIRTAAAIRDFGYNSETAATVTTTLAKALKLGSASASEQASVMLQFSQALQKGKLDGDEFRTVMENAGVVQELLAKRLGVTKGKIVEMAAAGKLQLQDLVGAMTDGAEQVNAIFNQMPVTIDEAFAVLNNSITQFVGQLDQTYGISQSTAGAIAFLAENIDTLGKAALVAGVGLLAMFAPAIIAGVVALGTAAAATAGGLGLIFGGLGAGAAAFELFGDAIGVSGSDLVTFKDIVKATAEELAALTAEEQRFAAFTTGTFRDAFGKSTADRIRDRALASRLGIGFAESTTVTKERPTPKIETPIDSEAARARKRYDKDILEAENRIEVARLEKDMIGRSSFEVEQMRVRQNLLNEARKAGVTLTGADLAQIEALADATARAVTEAETLRNAYEDVKQQSKEFLSGFITDLKDGEGATDALANALDRVSNRLIDMAVENLVESALGGLTGRGGNAPGTAGGSALLSLFGFANGGIAANGKPVPLPRFAKGGVSRSAAIFGEAGPEAAVPLPDGRRIPVDLRMPSASGGAGQGVNLTVAPVFNVENGTPEGVDKLKNEMVPLIQKVARTELAQAFERKDGFRRIKGS